MSNYSVLKQDINNNIYENQTQQITGTVLNAILNEMTASLGAGYQFAGVATLGMNPGDPDQRVFYLAGEGIYTSFGGIQVPAGKLGVLKWDNRWTLQTIDGLGGGGANLTGYVSVASTDDLPDEGQPTIGYLCGTNLYLYVGEGGDTKEGKYQDCGSFRGPQGDSVQDVEQTQTSLENGGVNKIKFTLSNGISCEFQVRNGTTSSGLFPTLAALQAAYPSPVVGQYAFVGAGFPADIYVCTTAGTWTDSGEDYDGDNVDLTDYATKAELNQLEAKVTENSYKARVELGNDIQYNKTTTAGVAFDEKFIVYCPAGKKFKFSFSSPAFTNNVVNFYYGNESAETYYGLSYSDTPIEITPNIEVAFVRIERGASGVVNSASVNVRFITDAVVFPFDNEEEKVGQIFLGNNGEITGQATAGVNFVATLNIPVEEGEKFVFYGLTKDILTNNVANISFYNDSSLVLNETVGVGETAITVPSRCNRITVNRGSSGVLSSGEVSLKYIRNGAIESKEYGTVLRKGFTATSGSAINETVQFVCEKGRTFTIGIYTTNDIFKNRAINLSIYYVDGTSQYYLISSNNPIIFTPTKLVTHISFDRSASGIVGSGSVVLGIFPWRDKMADIVYMADNGSDFADGFVGSPVKTLNRALSISNNVIVRGGEYEGNLDLSQCVGRDIRITAYPAEKPIFMNRTIIAGDGASTYDGNVYRVSLASAPSTKWIWQHLNGDTNTGIPQAEFHPLQRGLHYRNDCTKIAKVENAEDLATAVSYMNSEYSNGNYFWYYSGGYLYFTSPSAPDSIYHPVCISAGPTIYGENKGNTLNVTGISFYYGMVTLIKVDNSVFSDCISRYSVGYGAFHWTTCKNLNFVKCEAAGNIDTNGKGDGFNGDTVVDLMPITASVKLIDCWSHDNMDDGYSDHQGCNCIIRGGLYEYNQKGGVTPSFGSHCTCYDVISRKNINGFYYIGDAADAGKNGNAVFFNCIARDNTNDGFKVDGIKNGVPNTIICKSCASINNDNYGYEGVVYAYDCGAFDNTTGAKDNNVIAINTQSL